jgi:hypothetical protein
MAAIKPSGESLSFQMNETSLKPLSRILDRRYTVYFKTA